MRNIILTTLLTLVSLRSDCYDLQIITKHIESQYLKISIKNKSKKTLIFYNGLYQTDFKIMDNDKVENVGEVTSIASEEDYLDYQFDYSKNLINETMKKNTISFREAVIYLHYKNKFTLILPNTTKTFDLPIINKNITTKYKLDSTRPYFLSIVTIFSTEYIPKYVKDSLNSKNVHIITPKVCSDKISIDINKFFRRKKEFYVK